jgi:hypothetical protein
MTRRRRLREELKIVVGVCGRLKAAPRVRRQQVDGDDDGAYRLQSTPPLDAQIKTKIVAARRLDPADRSGIKFRAGHIEHRQSVGFPQIAHHCRIPFQFATQSFHDLKLCQRWNVGSQTYQCGIKRIRSVRGTEYGMQVTP